MECSDKLMSGGRVSGNTLVDLPRGMIFRPVRPFNEKTWSMCVDLRRVVSKAVDQFSRPPCSTRVIRPSDPWSRWGQRQKSRSLSLPWCCVCVCLSSVGQCISCWFRKEAFTTRPCSDCGRSPRPHSRSCDNASIYTRRQLTSRMPWNQPSRVPSGRQTLFEQASLLANGE